MKIVDFLDREQWSAFVQHHSKGSIFHTPEMFDVFRNTRRHVPLLLAAMDSIGEILALLVSIRVQTLPGLLGPVSSRAIFYAEPLCRDSEQGITGLLAIVAEHDRRVRHRVLFTEVRPLYEQTSERPALESTGYEHTAYLNYLTDVRKSPDQLIQEMSKHGRRDVRKGQRQGLKSEDATSLEGIEELYPLLRETYANARVPIAGKDLFINAVRMLAPHKMIKVFLVRLEGKAVAGSAVLCYKDTVFYWYAGTKRLKAICAMEVVSFEMLEWAHYHNFSTFDYGGAGWPDKAYGVRDFKSKLGGSVVNYGRYRKIYSPWKFAVAEKVYEVSRGLLSGNRLTLAKPERA